MALEDYKINPKTIMCWDSWGSMNSDISSYSTHLTTVEEALKKISDFQLIKGLVFGGNGWRQYTKINDSLYVLEDEVAQARTKAMKAAKKAQMGDFTPVLKKFLKEEGFTYDRSWLKKYDAPTNNLPSNSREGLGLPPGKYSYDGDFFEKFYVRFSEDFKKFTSTIELKQQSIEVGKDEEHEITYQWPDTGDIGDNKITKTTYDLNEAGIEKFKQDWNNYKSTLADRITKAKEEIAKNVKEIKELDPIKNTRATLKAAGYIKVSDYYYKKLVDKAGGFVLCTFINLTSAMTSPQKELSVWRAGIEISRGISSSDEDFYMSFGESQGHWESWQSEKKKLIENSFSIPLLTTIASSLKSSRDGEHLSIEEATKKAENFIKEYNSAKEVVSIE